MRTRRNFLASSASLLAAASLPSTLRRADLESAHTTGEPGPAARKQAASPAGYDPWLEVEAAALLANAGEVARIAGGRPVLAVLKNNAYGLGLDRVGPVLDRAPEIAGFAVVKPDEAAALLEAGVRKPILLMGLVRTADGADLARRGVRLAPFDDGAPALLRETARRIGRPVPVHLYIDTGMNRLGMRHDRALPWIEALAGSGDTHIEGWFTAFTEDDDFDAEQLARFRRLAAAARERGLATGSLHAASSHALVHRPDAFLDMVRPGLVLYGAYPVGGGAAALRPAFRLQARVVRVERIQAGDGVSYDRNYVADRPTWIATLPVGHADGYPRRAVEGAAVLIGGRSYPVIGAVSASHTILELGQDRSVEPGDTATLVGPEAEVHPNTLASRAGISVYDVLMHLGAKLPGFVV